MGLVNSPKYFQHVLNDLLQNVKNVKIFMDDVLIFSKSFEEHINHVKQVLQILKEKGAKVNFEKSKFGVEEVTFLGQRISKEGVRADLSKLELYKGLKPPSTIKQLRRLVGIFNWFRKFVPNMSVKIARISEKLKGKEVKVTWTSEDENIRQEIFNEIEKNTMLAHPDLNKNFLLQTDASNEGIGAILFQEKVIVGIYSKKFTESEKGYTTPEKELFAIIKALKHFENIVWGSKIIIETDNKDIAFQKKHSEARIGRWQAILSIYDISIKYLEGENNVLADFLSREFLTILTDEETIDRIEDFKNLMKNTTITKEEKEVFKLAQNEKSLLYVDSKDRVFVPPRLEERFLKFVHVTLIHGG